MTNSWVAELQLRNKRNLSMTCKMRHKGSHSAKMRWLSEVREPCRIWQRWTTWSNTTTFSILGLLMCLVPLWSGNTPPHTHTPEKIWVFSCRPGRQSERERRGGGIVKTQAGVPFCWPESGSSHVLLQHSQQHHTERQKVKGSQVITHTHTHMHNTFLPPSPSSSTTLFTPTPCILPSAAAN